MFKNILITIALIALIALCSTIQAQSVAFRLNNYSLKQGTNITDRLIQGAEIGYLKHFGKVLDLYVPVRIGPRGNVETVENSIKTKTTILGNMGVDAAIQAKYDNGRNFLVPFISAGFGAEMYDTGAELGAPMGAGLNFRVKKIFITLATNYRLPLTKTTPIGWMHSLGIVTKIGGGDKKTDAPEMTKQEKYLAQQEAMRIKEAEAKVIADALLKAQKEAEEAEKAKIAAENRAKEEAEYRAKMAAKAAALDSASVQVQPIVVSEEIKKVLDYAIQGVQFETGSALLMTDSYSKLDDVATTMIKNPELRISIEGHTDKTGNEGINMKLSESRARTCMNYLISKGITENRLKVESYGSTRPVTDNDTEIGRSRNRRVEFVPF